MATAGYRLTAALAVLVVAGTTATGWQGAHRTDDAARSVARVSAAPAVTPSVTPSAANSATEPAAERATAPAAPSPSPTAASGAAAAPLGGTPVVSAWARQFCPRAATACVDLTDRLTWLQSGGRISYGPVRIEPGPPGTANATPLGTFRVEWKAGPDYISNEYHEPMPWAVFFAPGGVAFHGGSLTTPSHGCVHLDLASARYYHDHLPIGAEVVVF